MKEIDELGQAAQRIVINSNSGVNRKEDCDNYLKKKAALLEIYENLHKILGQKRKQIQELKAANKELAEKAWKYDELCK